MTKFRSIPQYILKHHVSYFKIMYVFAVDLSLKYIKRFAYHYWKIAEDRQLPWTRDTWPGLHPVQTGKRRTWFTFTLLPSWWDKVSSVLLLAQKKRQK